jgi:hypothetical protein
MTFTEAVLDAAITVQILQANGARAVNIGRDLGCAPSWAAVEMKMRAQNRAECLFPPLMTSAELVEWGRWKGWS